MRTGQNVIIKFYFSARDNETSQRLATKEVYIQGTIVDEKRESNASVVMYLNPETGIFEKQAIKNELIYEP